MSPSLIAIQAVKYWFLKTFSKPTPVRSLKDVDTSKFFLSTDYRNVLFRDSDGNPLVIVVRYGSADGLLPWHVMRLITATAKLEAQPAARYKEDTSVRGEPDSTWRYIHSGVWQRYVASQRSPDANFFFPFFPARRYSSLPYPISSLDNRCVREYLQAIQPVAEAIDQMLCKYAPRSYAALEWVREAIPEEMRCALILASFFEAT